MTPHRYRLRRAIVSALIVALATVLGTACSRDDPASGRLESSPPVLGHVHGVGIDPSTAGSTSRRTTASSGTAPPVSRSRFLSGRTVT